MTPIVKFARNDISPAIVRYAAEMRKSIPVVVKSTAKGITRRVIAITPPASGDAAGRDAYNAGVNKISRQMQAVFVPKRLKGRRKITHVFGHKLKRPVYVKTREKWPDVRAAYKQHMHFRGLGLGVYARNLKDRKLYVDVRKFNAELKRRSANVGKLASGWTAAARALDVPVQAWIARHGTAGGSIRVDTSGGRTQIVVENLAPGLPPNVRSELARRIPYAFEYQAAAMERAIVGYHNRIRQQFGIRGRDRAP